MSLQTLHECPPQAISQHYRPTLDRMVLPIQVLMQRTFSDRRHIAALEAVALWMIGRQETRPALVYAP